MAHDLFAGQFSLAELVARASMQRVRRKLPNSGLPVAIFGPERPRRPRKRSLLALPPALRARLMRDVARSLRAIFKHADLPVVVEHDRKRREVRVTSKSVRYGRA